MVETDIVYWKNLRILGIIAVCAASRIILSGIANLEPVTVITVSCGVALGSSAGFKTGFFSTVLADLIALGAGPWTFFTSIAFGIIGFISGFIPEKLYKNRFFSATIGVSFTILFDLFTNYGHSIITGVPYKAAIIGGIWFMLFHIISNFFVFYIFSYEIVKSIKLSGEVYEISKN